MLDFIKWCEAKSLKIPEVTAENTKRSGQRGQYPDGYVRSQYPDAYFAPISATSYLDLKQAKGVKTVKDKVNSGM